MKRLGHTSRIALLGSVAVVCAATPSVALAQDAPAAAPEAAAPAPEPQGDEIIITAQKRSEAILDIPQSVTVVGGDTLERQHSVTFSDYLSQVPGLSLEQSEPGVGRLVLRGVNTGGVSSTVAIYVDETPFGSSTGLVNGAILAGDFDTFDVSRIEVLRGPQGTLYGASSLGGVLKFVTNAPEFDAFHARGRAGLEFVDGGGTGYNFSGMVNAPLGDVAAVRASGFYRKNAGWIDGNGSDATFFGVDSLGGKDINKGESYGGRASVLFKPTSELSIRLTGITQRIQSDASSDSEVDQVNYNPIGGKLRQSRWFKDPNELKYRVLNGVVEYDFGFASLLSSTSFSKQDQTFNIDAVPILGTALNVLVGALVPGQVIGPFQDQQTDLKKFTQEVRLASPSSNKFEWMIGAYYTHEKGKIDQFIGSVDLLTGQSFGIPLLDDLATARIDSKYKEVAGFANVTWHATDQFDITAGARLAKNDQSAHQVTASALGLVGASDFVTKSDESVFTYAISPRYEINDRMAVYARIAKGYRPGGPNVVAPPVPPGVPRTYSSDTLTSYEIGLKNNLGHGASFDIAAYHLKWKDIQLFSVVSGVGVNVNGGTAASNGIEASLLLKPVPGMTLGVNGAWIDAHLTEDTPPLAGGFDGDRLPYVPKVSFSVNTDYEWKLSGSATAFVGGTIAYTGSQRDNFNISDIVGVNPDGSFIFAFTPQRHISDYATIDLRAGIEIDRFTIEAYVKNLTNSEGVNSLALLEDQLIGNNVLPGNAIRAALTRPRTIGLSLTAGF
ncbi:TonB-dependent receptor [Sphingomonas daechungensis]|uniref:TonB-dependent receptor n=1 Tax=Sphingomonas daechungensis TaxID=1176646 RepID=A0ABX6SXL2_9SPHN|nr:TonB-dependent receptor [Sphingomonas daechungensis]